jgi:hypothetical protein
MTNAIEGVEKRQVRKKASLIAAARADPRIASCMIVVRPCVQRFRETVSEKFYTTEREASRRGAQHLSQITEKFHLRVLALGSQCDELGN